MTRQTGAFPTGKNRWRFTVYAPFREKVQVETDGDNPRKYDLQKTENGYWQAELETQSDMSYRYILDADAERPDPAARRQPEGVHGWSQLYAPDDFQWDENGWQNPELKDYIIYEIHTGTFSQEGTFEGIISKLDELKELGVTALEIMPVSPFPDGRNWGYDGVYPYAVQESYGGPDGLKKLVNACHQKGLAVILDVVYNHLGPEGNYLHDFGPFFTEKYKTPWGAALNFDDAHSDHVRAFFTSTVRQWLEEFRIDALRLDAVHAILDSGPTHLLKAMRKVADEVEKSTGRRHYLIAESDQNDVKLLNPYKKGGYGLDAQWADDFHHAIHTLATGENKGYYADYGRVEDLAKAFRQAFIYDGKYSPHREKTVGTNPRQQPPEKFVVCIQNHDQVGNRMLGERLSQLVSFEMQKLAAGLLLVSPYTPLLFMGEEYAADSPFQYFVSHGDPKLVKAVREGRAREFESFEWEGEVPDPQAQETFDRSKLRRDWQGNPEKEAMRDFYKYLIAERKKGTFHAFRKYKLETEADEENRCLLLRTPKEVSDPLLAVANFSASAQKLTLPDDENWQLLFTSAAEKWAGSGFDFFDEKEVDISAESLMVFGKI